MCEFCKGNEEIQPNKVIDLFLSIHKNQVHNYLHFDYQCSDSWYAFETKLRIYFCPICGEKIWKNKT